MAVGLSARSREEDDEKTPRGARENGKERRKIARYRISRAKVRKAARERQRDSKDFPPSITNPF